MINDLYRLNMEIVLTANKFSGIDAGEFHDGLVRQIEQQRLNTFQSSGNTRSWKFWKLIRRIVK